MPPVLQQASRFRSHLPLARVWPSSPSVHMAPHFVDDRGRIVLLRLRREAFSLIEHEARLARGAFPLLRLGDGRDKLCTTAVLKNLLCRLTLVIELPMPVRAIVRRVQ